MTYTGTMVMPTTSLVLPQNAVIMQEEEMRYLDGGKIYTKTTKSMTKKKAVSGLNKAMWAAYGFAAAATISCAYLGSLVAGPVGTAVGALGGVFAGSVIWGFGDTFADAAMTVQNKSWSNVKIKFQLNGFKLKATVLKG